MPSKSTTCKIALSLRVVNAQGYHEPRDALSQDWLPFLASCGVTPVLVPNMGEEVIQYLRAMDIAGLLLTGGNNVCPQSYGGSAGESVSDMAIERDQTESAMVQFAVERSLPILGVCRGMQFLNAFFGGSILASLKEEVPGLGNHVACQHNINIVSSRFAEALGVSNLRVNSYHDQGITEEQLSPSLECVALSESDGVVEALAHPERPIVGIQWHPERPASATEFDRALVDRLLVERTLISSQAPGKSR